MNARNITRTEKIKIEQIYKSSLLFKLEETLVLTVLAFIFISFAKALIQKIFSVSILSYQMISIFALITGIFSVYYKYEKRKKFLKKIFSRNKPVRIHFFNINRFINIYPKSKNQFEYLCEISKHRTLYLKSDKNLEDNLTKELKIETVQLEIPIVLSISKIGKESALQIFPKEINIGFLEENIYNEFYIHKIPITDLYL